MREPELIDLPTQYRRDKGSLVWLDFKEGLPFVPVRAYWASQMGDAVLGAHALKRQETLIVAAAGAFAVEAYRPVLGPRTFYLGLPYVGLYIPAGWWREVFDFDGTCAMLCLASTRYDPEDYIRGSEEYNEWVRSTSVWVAGPSVPPDTRPGAAPNTTLGTTSAGGAAPTCREEGA